MKHKLFLDTNILLDICLEGRPESKGSMCLESDIEFNAVEACTHAGILKDIYYILCQAVTEQDARTAVSAIMNFIEIEPLTYELCRQALDCDEPDYEDALIRICAEQIGADFIISRDEKAFVNSKIKRLSAQKYIEHIDDWHEIDFSLKF